MKANIHQLMQCPSNIQTFQRLNPTANIVT